MPFHATNYLCLAICQYRPFLTSARLNDYWLGEKFKIHVVEIILPSVTERFLSIKGVSRSLELFPGQLILTVYYSLSLALTLLAVFLMSDIASSNSCFIPSIDRNRSVTLGRIISITWILNISYYCSESIVV